MLCHSDYHQAILSCDADDHADWMLEMPVGLHVYEQMQCSALKAWQVVKESYICLQNCS